MLPWYCVLLFLFLNGREDLYQEKGYDLLCYNARSITVVQNRTHNVSEARRPGSCSQRPTRTAALPGLTSCPTCCACCACRALLAPKVSAQSLTLGRRKLRQSSFLATPQILLLSIVLSFVSLVLKFYIYFMMTLLYAFLFLLPQSPRSMQHSRTKFWKTPLCYVVINIQDKYGP